MIRKLDDILQNESTRELFIGDDPTYELALWFRSPTLQTDFPTEFWVQFDESGRPNQRVAATLPSDLNGIGFIGFMLNSNNAQDFSLLKVAEEHLKSLGCQTIFFPVNFATWFNYRLTDSEEETQQKFKWEPPFTQPYNDILKELRFDKARQYQTFGYESKNFKKAKVLLSLAKKKADQKGYSIKGFDCFSNKKNLLKKLYPIALNSFNDNYLFTSISEIDFCNYYTGIINTKDCSKSFVLENSLGEICGFIFSFIADNYVVIKSIAINKSEQISGSFGRLPLSFALLHQVFETCGEDNLNGGISAFMENNASSFTLAKTQKWAHTWTRSYTLFSKEISNCI